MHSVWVQPDEVLVFEIDIVHNSVRVKEKTWPFRRRWEATMLAKMLEAHDRGHKLDLSGLQQAVAQKGQTTPLNRSQIARLLLGIQAFLLHCPGVELRHMPRQASTGPWYLQISRTLRWSDGGPMPHAATSTLRSAMAWPHARMLHRSTSPNVEFLHAVLSQSVIAEAFAKYGDHRSAMDILRGWDWSLLSLEASAQYRLRQADWLRRTGQYDEARKLALALGDVPELGADPQLSHQARQLVRRIAYDENPGHAWRHLLEEPQPPAVNGVVCWATQNEWHNLQALAWRRAAQNAAEKNAALHAHENAMLHFEAAIYGALRQQNWDRLHAYIGNLAFHLQKVQILGLVTVRQVYDFYVLSLACADKLDSGQDDIWDLVYLGEFWLDHTQELQALEEHARHLTWPVQHRPQDQAYWVDLLLRTTESGTVRLQATALVLYTRWASLQRKNDLSKQLQDQLAQLFKQHTGLHAILQNDGYAPWLPVGL